MQIHEEMGQISALHSSCPSCGGKLGYSAKYQAIRCEHCGYEEAIDTASDKVVESSLAEAMSRMDSYVPEQEEKKVFDCGNCGARVMVEANQVQINCGFCGSENVNTGAYEGRYIQPVGIIPFYIGRERAEQEFESWIRRGWFYPSKLKQLASIQALHGIYIPFWTYDAHTESAWSGEAGYHHYESHRVMVNGKQQVQQVRKTRWMNRSGNLNHFFDDVLVVASKGLEGEDYMNRVFAYRLDEVVNHDPRLLMGWEAEIYNLEVDKGYRRADEIMDYRIRNMCSAQLGGDTQRNLHVRSSKHSQTFKHIILPLWICSYVYNNKVYRFAINGQTGRTYGQKPLSWVKIALAVLLGVLLLAALFYLQQQGAFG